MHASTIKIWGTSTALALIMVRATSLAPELAAKLPAPAPAPPGNLKATVLLPGAHVPFRQAATRRTSIVDQCFISNLEVKGPPTPNQVALVAAVSKEDWKTVLPLLDAGASVETADESGVTPLMAAARQGNVEIIRNLLARHASLSFAAFDGRSALHYAIASRKLEAVQFLLPLIPSLDATTVGGNDLLTLALETGDMRIFQTVLERFPANLAWTSDTRRALEAALRADMKEQVRLLLSKHPAHPTREGGIVPLIAYAIAGDDAALFHTLLACGSDPNIVIPKAAEKDFMSLLKSKYLRLYIQEETGINLLMLAAGLGKTDYVRALLDAGADRSKSTPREKMLPLYFAAWTENWQCVQMLLGGGPMPEELRVEISLAQQNMSVIKDGITVFTTKCSTGREGFTTKPGQE